MKLTEKLPIRFLFAGAMMANPFGSQSPSAEQIRSAFSNIQAQSYDSLRGLEKDAYYMKSFDGNDYLGFSKIDFGSGAQSLEIRVSAEKRETPQNIEVRLDSPEGPRIGVLSVIPTGSWGNFAPQYINIPQVRGVRDVYFVGQGGTGIGNIASFKFRKEAAPTQLRYGKFNSLDLILSDMKLKNDLPIQNIKATGAWAKGPGSLALGADATRVAPWAEVFWGEGNRATNSRVQVRNAKIYWQRKSDLTWHYLRDFSDPDAYLYGTDKYVNLGIPMNTRFESEGFSLQSPPFHERGAWTHLWSKHNYATDLPEPRNVRAIMVTAQFRLILDNPNGPDDRDSARYMFRIGADDPKHRKPGYIVQIVGSRGKRALKHWQSITAFTFSRSVGVDVWDNISENFGITEAEFRANPPPLD